MANEIKFGGRRQGKRQMLREAVSRMKPGDKMLCIRGDGDKDNIVIERNADQIEGAPPVLEKGPDDG